VITVGNFAGAQTSQKCVDAVAADWLNPFLFGAIRR
jgi:hypothetical protein